MTRTRWWLAPTVVGVVVGIPLAAVVTLPRFAQLLDGRDDIDLEGWLRDDAWTREVMPGARLATDEVCTDELPCNQAVSAQTLTMYRFDEQPEAQAAARRFAGEAYRSGWIVIRFEPAALTADQRREVALSVDCTNVGVTADGVEC